MSNHLILLTFLLLHNSWGLWLGLRNIMLISLFIHWLSLRMALKAPIYFKRNRRTNWYDDILNKIRPKRSLFWVRFGSSKQLTKANFLGKFVLAPKHLWATIGPWQSVGVFWNWIFFFSFNKGQAGEQHPKSLAT